MTILGAGSALSIIKPGFNTTVSGNVKSESFIYVGQGVTATISGLTIDCLGQQVNHALQSRGALTVDACAIKNVRYGLYNGRGIVFFGGTGLVTNTVMTGIERIGIHVRGNVMTPNPVVAVAGFTYTGKGVGDWLDYGVEFGGGGSGTVEDATITNCKGVASIDGSTSAGVLVTDFWGTGTSAVITNSHLNSNSTGIAAGYNETDASVVAAHYNDISGNSAYGISSTHPLVDATQNWWGAANGPLDTKTLPGVPNYNNLTGGGNAVTSLVSYNPYLSGNFALEGCPHKLNLAHQSKSVDVMYLGGGSAPLFGYSVILKYKTDVIRVPNIGSGSIPNIAEGTLFGSGTTFNVSRMPNEGEYSRIRIDASRLNQSRGGVNGPGLAFTVLFEAVADCGTSPVVITILNARDAKWINHWRIRWILRIYG